MDRDDWNRRYAAQELVWGSEPNRFVAEEFRLVPPRGRALDLACGEGRNAIWLAERGWTVTAADYSAVAIDKGRRLATGRSDSIDWRVADATADDLGPGPYDLVVFCYLQLPADEMATALARAAALVAPGGALFVIGHARRNLTEGVGGPQDPAVLYEPDDVATWLRGTGLEVVAAAHVTRNVDTPDGARTAIDTRVVARPAS
jgi:SAM-dependent methyltransferase